MVAALGNGANSSDSRGNDRPDRISANNWKKTRKQGAVIRGLPDPVQTGSRGLDPPGQEHERSTKQLFHIHFSAYLAIKYPR